jgi:hypothetical protein
MTYEQLQEVNNIIEGRWGTEPGKGLLSITSERRIVPAGGTTKP